MFKTQNATMLCSRVRCGHFHWLPSSIGKDKTCVTQIQHCVGRRGNVKKEFGRRGGWVAYKNASSPPSHSTSSRHHFAVIHCFPSSLFPSSVWPRHLYHLHSSPTPLPRHHHLNLLHEVRSAWHPSPSSSSSTLKLSSLPARITPPPKSPFQAYTHNQHTLTKYNSERMDIGNIFEEWDFSGTVPLPYRVLLMGCIGIFAWASNIHILAHLRVDVSNLLFSSPPLSGLYSNSGSRHRDKFASKSSPLSALYRSIYTLGAGFLAMTLINMWMYKWVVAGSGTNVASSGAVDARGGMGQKGNPRAGIMVPILGYITIVVMIFAPINVLFKKERFRFLR